MTLNTLSLFLYATYAICCVLLVLLALQVRKLSRAVKEPARERRAGARSQDVLSADMQSLALYFEQKASFGSEVERNEVFRRLADIKLALEKNNDGIGEILEYSRSIRGDELLTGSEGGRLRRIK